MHRCSTRNRDQLITYLPIRVFSINRILGFLFFLHPIPYLYDCVVIAIVVTIAFHFTCYVNKKKMFVSTYSIIFESLHGDERRLAIIITVSYYVEMPHRLYVITFKNK